MEERPYKAQTISICASSIKPQVLLLSKAIHMPKFSGLTQAMFDRARLQLKTTTAWLLRFRAPFPNLMDAGNFFMGGSQQATVE